LQHTGWDKPLFGYKIKKGTWPHNGRVSFLNKLFLGVGRGCISHCKTARPERGTGVPNIYGGRRLVEGLVGQRNKCFTNVLLAVFSRNDFAHCRVLRPDGFVSAGWVEDRFIRSGSHSEWVAYSLSAPRREGLGTGRHTSRRRHVVLRKKNQRE
jgi:hypothetical protein